MMSIQEFSLTFVKAMARQEAFLLYGSKAEEKIVSKLANSEGLHLAQLQDRSGSEELLKKYAKAKNPHLILAEVSSLEDQADGTELQGLENNLPAPHGERSYLGSHSRKFLAWKTPNLNKMFPNENHVTGTLKDLFDLLNVLQKEQDEKKVLEQEKNRKKLFSKLINQPRNCLAREEEKSTLTQAIQNGGAILITGELGIGKRTLIEAVAPNAMGISLEDSSLNQVLPVFMTYLSQVSGDDSLTQFLEKKGYGFDNVAAQVNKLLTETKREEDTVPFVFENVQECFTNLPSSMTKEVQLFVNSILASDTVLPIIFTSTTMPQDLPTIQTVIQLKGLPKEVFPELFQSRGLETTTEEEENEALEKITRGNPGLLDLIAFDVLGSEKSPMHSVALEAYQKNPEKNLTRKIKKFYRKHINSHCDALDIELLSFISQVGDWVPGSIIRTKKPKASKGIGKMLGLGLIISRKGAEEKQEYLISSLIAKSLKPLTKNMPIFEITIAVMAKQELAEKIISQGKKALYIKQLLEAKKKAILFDLPKHNIKEIPFELFDLELAKIRSHLWGKKRSKSREFFSYKKRIEYILQFWPDCEQAITLLGVIADFSKDILKAEEFYRKALAIGKRPDTYLNYARFLKNYKRNAEAVRMFIAASEMDSSYTQHILNAAKAYRLSKNYDRAIELLEKAKELEPDTVAHWEQLAFCRMERNNVKCNDAQKAKESFSKVLEIDPNHKEASAYFQKEAPSN